VWANKIGTAVDHSGRLCRAGNYEPAWLKGQKRAATAWYAVAGRWAEDLWKAYKLSDAVYREYLHLSKDGIAARRRNLEAFEGWREENDSAATVASRTKRIRGNEQIYQPFGAVPEAQDWIGLFARDALRYPILLVHAPSHSGRTEWAASLFKKPLLLEIGDKGVFPNEMRKLNRKIHDALILDDIRDLTFLTSNQEQLQGKYDRLVEFASSACGQHAFCKDLFCLPVVGTINNDTRNLDLLITSDFLSNPNNVRLLSFSGKPGQVPPSTTLQFFL